MSWGMVAGAAASVVGSSLQGDAASDAADKQVASGERASATQEAARKQQREDLMPWMRNGTTASNQLSYLLGIGGSNANAPEVEQYLRDSAGRGYDSGYRYGEADRAGVQEGAVSNYRAGQYGNSDEALRLFGYQAPAGQASQYGSLNRKFGQSDLDSDLVYQNGLKFGLDTGVNQLNQRAAASGGYGSGAALKALTRFGNDYATTKTEGAYNRNMGEKNQQYNFLSGISQQGQNAAANVGAAGISTANSIAGNQMGAGNAQAAGIVGGANAMSNGLAGATNAYQWNQLMSRPNSSQSLSNSWDIPMQPGGGY